MKKILITQSLITALTCLILLTGFYLFFLKPKIEIPKKLLEIENLLTDKKLNLSQNRVSLIELTKLDARNREFPETKDQLLITILESNEKGLKGLEKEFKTKGVTSTPSEISNFINTKLLPGIPILLEKHKEILERQKQILPKIEDIEKISKNLFIYDPVRDLGSVKLITEKAELVNRIANTINGLEDINTNLQNDIASTQESKNLTQLILDTQKNLEALQKEVENENEPEATRLLANLIEYFAKIRQSALELELNILRSSETVELIKDETNLILEYDFWLDRINYYQNMLAEKEQQD